MLWSAKLHLNASSGWHRHEVFEWIFCLSDGGRLEFDGQQIEFHTGRSICIAPQVEHRFAFAPGESARLKLICLEAADIGTFLSFTQAAFLSSIRTAGATFADHDKAAGGGNQGGMGDARALLAHIPDDVGQIDVPGLQVAWGAVSLLLALHGQWHVMCGNPKPDRYRDTIRNIREWLEPRLDDTIDLDRTARQFGLSRSVLTREFRRHTGRSLIDYCNARRVEKAARILAASTRSITAVALESGFANLSHFHRQFKASYGMTPAAFRRMVNASTNLRRAG